MRALRLTLLATSAAATIAFTLVFVLSFVRPVAVESFAREMIRREVERRVGERVAPLDGGLLTRLGARAARRNAEALVRLKVAAVVAEMQVPDCKCRTFFAAAIDVQSGINDQLQRLIRAKYMQAANALLREVRIFSAANALVFLLLFATTCARRRAGLQLLLPAVVLAGAAVLVAGLYLFGQDWLHTIVFSDYTGLTYFAYLGAAMLFLADVAFNRARVSTTIVNAAFNAAGVALSAVPC